MQTAVCVCAKAYANSTCTCMYYGVVSTCMYEYADADGTTRDVGALGVAGGRARYS